MLELAFYSRGADTPYATKIMKSNGASRGERLLARSECAGCVGCSRPKPQLTEYDFFFFHVLFDLKCSLAPVTPHFRKLKERIN